MSVFSGAAGNDFVIDNARGLIYISTDNGEIQRYDIDAQSFVSAITVGSLLQGLSLSQDGNTLVVADRTLVTDNGINFAQFHTIDLDTLSVSTVEFASNAIRDVAFDVAVDVNDNVIVSTSLHYFLHLHVQK